MSAITCKHCGTAWDLLEGEPAICLQCATARAAHSAGFPVKLKESLVIAWGIALAFWAILLIATLSFAFKGYSSAAAGFVFGGLAANFVLWRLAHGGRPYAGALWAALACAIVCLAWMSQVPFA